jgi:hypothetical protein
MSAGKRGLQQLDQHPQMRETYVSAVALALAVVAWVGLLFCRGVGDAIPGFLVGFPFFAAGVCCTVIGFHRKSHRDKGLSVYAGFLLSMWATWLVVYSWDYERFISYWRGITQ